MTEVKSSAKFEFEAAMKELESIAAWFESSNVDLDEGLVKFERGMELAEQLRTHLATIGNRVEKIKARFDQPSALSSIPADAGGDEDADEPDDASAPELF